MGTSKVICIRPRNTTNKFARLNTAKISPPFLTIKLNEWTILSRRVWLLVTILRARIIWKWRLRQTSSPLMSLLLKECSRTSNSGRFQALSLPSATKEAHTLRSCPDREPSNDQNHAQGHHQSDNKRGVSCLLNKTIRKDRSRPATAKSLYWHSVLAQCLTAKSQRHTSHQYRIGRTKRHKGGISSRSWWLSRRQNWT